MKRIACITPAGAAPGFALAGMLHQQATTAEAAELLRQLTGSGEFGLIVVDERLLDPFLEEYIGRRQETWPGIIVVLPPPGDATRERDYAERLLQKAIGYQVRLNP